MVLATVYLVLYLLNTPDITLKLHHFEVILHLPWRCVQTQNVFLALRSNGHALKLLTASFTFVQWAKSDCPSDKALRRRSMGGKPVPIGESHDDDLSARLQN